MAEMIFVVDSQTDVVCCAKQILEAAGYAVRTFSRGEVFSRAVALRPSLILVALSMSDGFGQKLCEQVRSSPTLGGTPIIILVDRNSAAEHILARASGADDCVVKPLRRYALLASVQSVLSRFDPPFAGTPDLVFDTRAMRLSVYGKEIETTTLEFRLLEYMALHRGQAVQRDVLLDEIWGEAHFITPRSVDTCMRRIRKKIEPSRSEPTILKTIRGVGYRLDATAAWKSSSDQGCNCKVCREAGAANVYGYRPRRIRRTPWFKAATSVGATPLEK